MEEKLVIIFVGLYFLGMLLIGYLTSKKIKDVADFLVAGRRLGFLLATATMFATWFGGESVIGAAGTVYEEGISGVIADPFGASFCLILAGLFYAAAFRKLEFLTVVDVFHKFYNKPLEFFATFLMIPVYIGWLAAQIVATGLVFSSFTKIDINLGMYLGSFVILAYTISGGMWAVTVTDFVQMIILVVGILVLLPFTLNFCGGLKNIFVNTPKEFFNFFPQQKDIFSILSYLGKWSIVGLGCVIGQDLIQRSLSSKNVSVARLSSIVAGIMYLTIGLVVITLGLAGRLVFSEIENSENIIPFLAKKFLGGVHPVFYAIFISGLLAAIMSSADSSLLAAVSLISNNIFVEIFPNMSEKKILFINRIVTIVVTLISLSLALYVKQVYNLLVTWSFLLVAIFVPITAALFFRKITNVYSGWFSMSAGLVVFVGYIIYRAGGFIITDATMEFYYQASFLGFLASIFGYVVPLVFIKRLQTKYST